MLAFMHFLYRVPLHAEVSNFSMKLMHAAAVLAAF
jgi:hypothetical protein